MKTKLDLLRLRSFEYAYIKLVLWHLDSENVESQNQNPQSYNSIYSIDINKILIFPFFICVSNGSLNYLFNLWGNFFAFPSGPLSKPISEEIFFDNCFNFRYLSFDRNSFRLLIDKNFSIAEIVVGLKDEIEKLENVLNIQLETALKKDKSTILAIENSIKKLRLNNSEMTLLSHNDLKKRALSFNAYEKLLKVNSNMPINLDELKEDASLLTLEQIA